MSSNVCEILLLGRMPYLEAWDLQAAIAAQVAAGERPPALLLLEHPHVYTFGRRGRAENLIWDEAERARRGVAVHWVDRGGDVTYHGPGQLVGYPILPLIPGGLQARDEAGYRRFPRADLTGYLRDLEKTLIKTLAAFGLAGGQIEGLTGVWIQPDVASRCRHCPPEAKKRPSKIAAIGVKFDVHGVTRHGFALNVATDPAYWEGIVGCGLDYPVVNLADLLWNPPSMEAVIDRFIEAFETVFGYEAAVREDRV
ncbi:MAG TPA: lipoyl(octanoyl) transferase LipB [Anaerolineales bacterium]|nr:lipoyl(octanoyl) transferase LipB [Anaerolineales bacterium]